MSGADFDAYAAWEEEQQARVQAALAPEQRALTWGDHFVRFWKSPAWGPEAALVIFGRVYTWAELEAVEESETLERIRQLEDRVLYAWCASSVEPEGEPGDTNRWDMWPITSEQYQQAKDANWNPYHPDVHPWVSEAAREIEAKRGTFTNAPLPPGWQVL